MADHACPLRARQDGESREFTVTHGVTSMSPDLGGGRSEALHPKPSKLVMRVRFPSPAPSHKGRSGQGPPLRGSVLACQWLPIVPVVSFPSGLGLAHSCH